MVTVYFVIRYIQARHQVGMIVSIAAAVMAATALFYNLSEVRNAKVPASAMKRAKRR